MLIGGRVSSFVILIFLFATALIFIYRSKKWAPTLRRIPGLDALEEAIGRATEMGRPVHFTPGVSFTLNSAYGPQIVAGMSVLQYIARYCARNNTRLLVSLGMSDVIPLATENVREAYIEAGALDEYRPEDITFYSNEEFPYCVGVMGVLEREKPAANIMIGPFYGDQIAFSEVGYKIGAIQIGGTARIVQIPFFAVACDYTLIGEEIFAISAYLSKDPVQLNSIVSQDIFKVVAIVILLIGVIMFMGGSNMVIQLLTL